MATTAKISRDDLEAKLREISGGVEETVEAARPKLISTAAGGRRARRPGRLPARSAPGPGPLGRDRDPEGLRRARWTGSSASW